MQRFYHKSLKPSDLALLETAFYLIRCTQWSYEPLELHIKKLAYHFNKAIYPDLDQYYIALAEAEAERAKAKKTAKQSKGVMTVEGIEESIPFPELPPLTEAEKQLYADFEEYTIQYLYSLPCFTSKFTEAEQKGIILTLKTHLKERKNAPSNRGKDNITDCYSERKRMLSPDYVADYLINNFKVIKIEQGETKLTYYNGETYINGNTADGADVIEALLTDIRTIEPLNPSVKDTRIPLNTDNLIKSLNSKIRSNTKLAPSEYLTCLNGIVYLDRDKIQLELQPFTPDIVTIYQYRANFKPLSEIPAKTVNKIARYFDYLFNRENEIEAHFQELKGRCLEYCSTILYRGQRFKKFGFFHGSHDGGKTSFIEKTLFSLIPLDSYSKIPLNQLHERFAISGLVGKLANLYDENNFSYGREGLAQQEKLKELISDGQKIRAERKNVNAFDFVCDARMFITLNGYLNITDKATEFKMLYIPMRGNLNREECIPFYPDMNNQDERDYIFNVLLQYLQKVFNNYKTTGEYFTKSEYIDSLQHEAEFKTSELLNLIQSWITETEPFKEYPYGQLISERNKSLMLASHYCSKFNEYLFSNNYRMKVTQYTFRSALVKSSDFICVSIHDSNYRNCTYSNMLIPKHYNGVAVSSYPEYKQAIMIERTQRTKTANIIAVNTKGAYQDIKSQILSSVI